MYLENNPTDDLTQETMGNPLDLELEKKFYVLKNTDIMRVDTKESFLRFLGELLENTNSQELVYVGVDSEWKPTCVGGLDVEANIMAALVQVKKIIMK